MNCLVVPHYRDIRKRTVEAAVLKIVVDHGKCSALGICESLAPELFEVQDDGSLLILNERPEGSGCEAARAAVEGCPTEALSITEDD
jgi:ferredoxin